jgi:opacity protein-like surface antigen
MLKNRSIILLFCMMFVAVTLCVYGQVVPSANAHQPKLTAGAFGSAFQPDYAGNGISQASPNPLIGIGAFVDYRINRFVAVEGEANWLRFNQYVGINESTYTIGPKIYIHQFGRFAPYGKVLVGMGGGSFLNGHTTALAYGGGVDYNLSSHWMLRAGDFEFQQWFVTPQLHPYGGSVGIAYKIFR